MMTSNKPYLIRAFYDWIVDNECSPYLVVDTSSPDVRVPQEFITDGQIVLNLKPSAVQGLELGKDFISFNARFSGRPHHIVVPCASVLAIYARENGAGTVFGVDALEDEEVLQEDNSLETQEPTSNITPQFGVIDNDKSKADSISNEVKPKKGAHLKVIK